MTKQNKKKKRNPLLPIIGLVLALSFAGIAYVVEPPVEAFLVNSGVSLSGLAPTTLRLLLAGMIWLVLFGTAMFIVAILSGHTPDEDESLRFYKESARRKKEQRRQKSRRR